MLKVKQLKVRGLAPVSFEIGKGDCLVVRGASGSGKSLLLRAIADLDPVEGTVSLDGKPSKQMPAEDWRKNVRYLASDSGWWFETVIEHFSDLESVRKLATELHLKEKLLQGPVAHLSSGERQRMAFIRAIEDQPQVLLLDEPTSALDEQSADLMETMIMDLCKKGAILIIVTHSQVQADRLASHVLTLRDGVARMESPKMQSSRMKNR